MHVTYMYMYMTQKSEGVNINCMSRCRSTSSTSIHGQHSLLHECTLHTMQMHEVHQESRDFFPTSLATGTDPKSRDSWHVCMPSKIQRTSAEQEAVVASTPTMGESGDQSSMQAVMPSTARQEVCDDLSALMRWQVQAIERLQEVQEVCDDLDAPMRWQVQAIKRGGGRGKGGVCVCVTHTIHAHPTRTTQETGSQQITMLLLVCQAVLILRPTLAVIFIFDGDESLLV